MRNGTRPATPFEAAAKLAEKVIGRDSGGEFTCPICNSRVLFAIGDGAPFIVCKGRCPPARVLQALGLTLDALTPAGGSRSDSTEVVPGNHPPRSASPEPPIQRGNGGGSAGSWNHLEPGLVPGSPPLRGEPVTPPMLFEPLSAFLERTANLPPPSWLVPDLVPSAGRLLVVAAPNAGKTFLALVIAKAAAVIGRPVLLVLEEGSPKSTGDRLKNLAFPADAPVLIAHLRGLQLDEPRLLESVTTAVAPVVVLDPFVSLFHGDENETKAMAVAAALLEQIYRANSDALVVLCHHTSKTGERGEGGSGIYAGRGSTVLPAWADVQINLTHEATRKNSGCVSFLAKVEKCRDGERGHSARVTISLGAGEVTFDHIGEAGRAAKDDRLRAKALAILGKAKRPRSKNDISERIGGNRQSLLRILDELEDAGEIRRADGGYVLVQESQITPFDRGSAEDGPRKET
jgi:hypothetical protein